MPHRDLAKKPLVEAIVEVRWDLATRPPGVQFDPHYKLLLGRLQERIRTQYPEYEQLPTATIPDELVAYTVQHRFRRMANGWPLVQLGPGILTFNETESYNWTTFRPSAIDAVQRLFDAHPQPNSLRIGSLLLRYIDAVSFDYEQGNLLDFLRDKMKVGISLPQGFFDGRQVERKPSEFTWQGSFASHRPTGLFSLKFSTGRRTQTSEPIIVWETALESKAGALPSMPQRFTEWLDAAHETSTEIFFKLIEGDLERQFAGE